MARKAAKETKKAEKESNKAEKESKRNKKDSEEVTEVSHLQLTRTTLHY